MVFIPKYRKKSDLRERLRTELGEVFRAVGEAKGEPGSKKGI